MVDRSILPYMIQAIMGQTGGNSPVSQYGDEVTALADKSIFDLQNEIDKDQAFRSPLEDLGAIGSKTDFSVYGGVGKGAREKGQMYNLIAGLLSGASSGLGEGLSRDSRTEAKEKLVKALTSRDAEQLGEDSRMKPYKDKVNLFNERLGGLEANMRSKSDLAGKGLEAITKIQIDPAPAPRMSEYQERMLGLREKELNFKQDQSSEMAQIRQQVEENKRKEAQGLPTSEIVISRNDGQPSIKIDANTGATLVKSGTSFDDISNLASEVNEADPTATPDPIAKTRERVNLLYGGEDYKVSDTEVIPHKYAGIKGFIEDLTNTGANPKQIEDYVTRKVDQINEADKLVKQEFKVIVDSLKGSDMANQKNATAFKLLSSLKGSLANLAEQYGENKQIGSLNSMLANVANKVGVGEYNDLAELNGLVESLRQYWTGISRTPGMGSQSDMEFQTALQSFQNPNLSIKGRLEQVDTMIKNMEKVQRAINVLNTAPKTAGYANTLAYVRNLLDSESSVDGASVAGVAPTPTPTPTPEPNQTKIPSYQDYLMLARGQ